METNARRPSLRSTMRSTSRTGSPPAITSVTIERSDGLPSSVKKCELALNWSWVWPGVGALPQISTARRLYCRMVPRASQMKVAIGKRSRMPSEARSIALSAGGIGRVAGRG